MALYFESMLHAVLFGDITIDNLIMKLEYHSIKYDTIQYAVTSKILTCNQSELQFLVFLYGRLKQKQKTNGNHDFPPLIIILRSICVCLTPMFSSSDSDLKMRHTRGKRSKLP